MKKFTLEDFILSAIKFIGSIIVLYVIFNFFK